VFAGRNGGGAATLGAGQYKEQFDKLSGVTDWRLHDLRRTARSLMSRAGVQSEVAERVLGHTQGELIEIYDRHDYAVEMAAALEKLAALIELIVKR
jgi:integrase